MLDASEAPRLIRNDVIVCFLRSGTAFEVGFHL